MGVSNLNKYMIDLPIFEQLDFAKATGTAGTNICDDGVRFIYTLIQTSATACQFWRYDTWTDNWQQLATPPTQTGTIANMTFVDNMGGQYNGDTYGAIYLFVGNGTTCYFYKFDIATNTWSANLGTTNVPATFGTDAYIVSLSPNKNNFDANYHSGVTRTITTSTNAVVGATSITVNATVEAMAIGTRLRFGTFNITVGANAIKGSTSITVGALSQGLASGCILKLPNGEDVCLSAAASSGATSISVYPIQKDIANGTIISVELYAVLTAIANAGATSLTVSALNYSIPSGSNAYYYGNIYLVGNNATVIYRYNIGTATWSTTSANSGNPAFPAVPGTVGTGCGIKWVPGISKDKLYIIRGNATSTIYVYDLVLNTITTLAYKPDTETFTTGTSVALRQLGGKGVGFLIQKDSTGRIYELDLGKLRMLPKISAWLYPQSTAVVGDKGCCITSPDGIEYYYLLLNSSTAFVRCALLDS